jgi:hypothetical protein
MKKSLIIITSAVSIAATTAGTVAMASAQSTSGKTTSSVTSTKKEHVHIEARLNQAVRDGTITEAQKTSLQSELKTLKAERKAALSPSSTKTERQVEHSKLKTELQAWATSNNFPLAKIAPHLAS